MFCDLKQIVRQMETIYRFNFLGYNAEFIIYLIDEQSESFKSSYSEKKAFAFCVCVQTYL